LNIFDEFKSIAKKLEDSQIEYALIGGIAMAFHDEPRFTRDIDILIDEQSLERIGEILIKCGYFESSTPWTFRNIKLTLHRYAKAQGEDILLIDILVAGDKKQRDIINNAIQAESEHGIVRVARKEDLIWLKQLRNSKQDRADIERLSNDQNR